MRISDKFLVDRPYKNDIWARLGGVSQKTMAKLEVYMLMCLQFDLYVDSATYAMFDRLVRVHECHSMKYGIGYSDWRKRWNEMIQNGANPAAIAIP